MILYISYFTYTVYIITFIFVLHSWLIYSSIINNYVCIYKMIGILFADYTVIWTCHSTRCNSSNVLCNTDYPPHKLICVYVTTVSGVAISRTTHSNKYTWFSQKTIILLFNFSSSHHAFNRNLIAKCIFFRWKSYC